MVEHGADVTITEKDGMRPYSIAVEKGDMEMAEYFKSLEPTEFHDIQNKMDQDVYKRQERNNAVSISTAHVIGVQEHETKCDWKLRTTDQIIDV